MGDKFFMDFSFFAHRFFKENLRNFFSQMPNALGICGTMYKVKKEENLFLGELWLPSQNARTRVRLLYLFHLAFKKVFVLEYSIPFTSTCLPLSTSNLIWVTWNRTGKMLD